MLRTVIFGGLFAFLCSCTLLNAEAINSLTDFLSHFNNVGETSVSASLSISVDLDFTGKVFPLKNKNGECITFTGNLNGNGHTFKNIIIASKTGEKQVNAGIFCKLSDGAIIQNLVIDSSCSFTGVDAGALSPLAEGKVDIIHVTNKASVTITNPGRGGGFIGKAEDSTITIQDSVNEGMIDSKDGYHVGGFIGLVSGTLNSTVTIDNCTNIGTLQYGTTCGGFVGTVEEASNATIMISNSVSGGTITSEGYGAGGFIGRIFEAKANATIINSTNNCNIIGSDKGDATSGFIGVVNPDEKSSINVLIQNCANYGNFSEGRRACGFFCVNSGNKNSNRLKSTVENSINKGSISASEAYGIATTVTNVNNVVSMGEVVGKSQYTLWEKCSNPDSFYALKDRCFNCPKVPTSFEYNDNTMFYETMSTSERVDNLLNKKAASEQYGMYWTSKLDLVHEMRATVSVRGEINDIFPVPFGTKLGDIDKLRPYFESQEYVVVNGGTDERKELTPEEPVSDDVDVIVGQYVDISFSFPSNTTVKAVTGEVLERSLKIINITTEQFIIAENISMQVQYNTSIIHGPTHFLLCHKVTTWGVLNTSFLLEHNQTLDNAGNMSAYFTPAFIVANKTNTSHVLKSDVRVTADIHVSITNVTILEVIIKFDDNEDITAEDVEDAIREISPDLVIGVDVIRRDDGSFVVSIKSNDEGNNGILDALGNCTNPSS